MQIKPRVSRLGPAAPRSKTQYDDVAGDVVVDCTDWMTWRVKPDPFCRSRAKKERGTRKARCCAWAVWTSARAGACEHAGRRFLAGLSPVDSSGCYLHGCMLKNTFGEL